MEARRRHVVATLVVLVLVEALFGAAFTWQLRRAVGGNGLSWVYVVEWPFLGAYAIWFTYCDLTGRARTLRPAQRAPQPDDGEALAAYNAYLADLAGPGAPSLAGEDSNP